VVIRDQVADKVTTRKIFHAMHKGDSFGISASDKKVVMEIIDIIDYGIQICKALECFGLAKHNSTNYC
jgi:hypothetical protein